MPQARRETPAVRVPPARPVVIVGPSLNIVEAPGEATSAIALGASRFAQTREQIAEAAAALGRPAPPWFGINAWCGLDADAAQARRLLASRLEGLCHLPFGKFERLTPAGPPAQVAEALASYRAAGAGYITLIPAATSPRPASSTPPLSDPCCNRSHASQGP